MTRLNSRKLTAIAATFIITGFVLGCTGVRPTASSSLSFPDVVRFEQGATRFLDGDRITITEVRGTADAITPGNIYCIKGTYTLASHRQAMLAAFVTARDPADGKSGFLKVQKIMATQGTGTFSLFLPVTISGWPHVSFYPADGGESFGGNYFGTGNFVLKQWWGSKHTDTVSTPNNSPGSTPTNFTINIPIKQPAPPRDKSDNPGIGPLPWGVR
jgi:hypothetical protein